MPEATTVPTLTPTEKQPIRDAATAIINTVQANTYVQYATEKLAPYTSPVMDKLQPVIATATSYTSPIVSSVDSRLSTALSHVPDLRRKLVDSSWFSSVDSVLSSRPAQQLSPAELTKKATDFYTAAIESFAQLAAKGKVKRSEYLATLKTRLSSAWDEGLIAPAETLLESARKLYGQVGGSSTTASSHALASLRSHLPADFQDSVASVYAAARARSQSVYDAAVRIWLARSGSVSVNEFVAIVKSSLGSTWNDKLEQPIVQLFTNLNKWQHEEVKKWHSYLDQNKDGALSVGDLVGTGRVATASLVSGATGVVSSTWHTVLDKTQSAVDVILPASPATEEKEPPADSTTTITSITSSVSSRLYSRATATAAAGFDLVKDFSATHVSPTVGVDPVATASTLVTERGLPAVKTLQQQIQDRIEAASTQLHRSSEALQTAGSAVLHKAGLPEAYTAGVTKASELKSSLAVTATALSDRLSASVPDKVKKASPEIQQRLVAVKDAAVELTTHSGGVLINDPLVALPAEVVGVVVQLPSLLLGYLETNDNNDPTGTLAKIDHVLSAVKELFYWSTKQAQVSSSKPPSDAFMAELKSKLAVKEAVKESRASITGKSNGNGSSSAAVKK